MAVRKLSSLLIKSLTLLFVFVLAPLSSPQTTKALTKQTVSAVETELGIEIITPRDAKKGETDKLFPTGLGSAAIIPLDHLTIFDKELAQNHETVAVEPSYYKDFVRVRIVMDSDIFCGKPCETFVGTYSLREGERIFPPELKQFGIEPFEVKAVTKTIKPTIDPKTQIINKTKAIKVFSVEGVFVWGDEKGYSLLMKNISDKDIASINFAYGKHPLGVGALGDGSDSPILCAGTFYCYRPMRLGLGYRGEFLPNVITINSVIFTDGTVDGDAKTTVEQLNGVRAIKIVAPKILVLIDKVLASSDEELPFAVEKFQLQLNQLFPNSISSEYIEYKLKTEYPDLIASLKKQYPSLSKKELDDLTWRVISGWDAVHLVDLIFQGYVNGKLKLSLEEFYRGRLIEIKEKYERIINSNW